MSKLKVGILMGSDSDLPIIRKAVDTLVSLDIPYEVHVYSAHRTPAEAADFARNARTNGFGAIIAAAGMAAHLAGAVAAQTTLPVIGIPCKSTNLDGLDALLSTVQMPSGIPVATVAIDGGVNAALLCAQIFALGDEELAEKLIAKRASDREKVLGKDALALIYRGDVYMSQSRLDSFRSCPFSYFAKYVLHLNEERRSELSADVIGIFIHSVLEVFFKTVYEGGGSVADLTDQRRTEIAELASRSYIEDILGGGFGEARTENVIERLCRAARPVIDGLCEELGNCKYKPVFFELSTEGKESDAPDPLTIDLDGESKLVISGFVDRVDSLKVGDDVYVRVVDYKSGSKSFSPADLAKGENLQMFLYLKSIVDTDKPEFLERMGVTGKGGLVPAGVMYVKTSLRDVTVDTASDEDAEKARRELSGREGMLLDEEMSIGAMNPYYLPDGVTDPESAYRYSREGWDEISRTVEGVVVELAKRMKSGDISANPKIQGSKSPCTYCPYKPICRTVRKK